MPKFGVTPKKETELLNRMARNAIHESDLEEKFIRSGGPGGQSVNTTYSAVRITHLPTGEIAQCQDEKSQHKNRAKAMKVLRARLYDAERRKAEDERASTRKQQVGSGDRSERIRTYNYPQGRVTDHRINLTLYKLDKMMSGEAVNEVVDALVADHQASLLADLEARFDRPRPLAEQSDDYPALAADS